MKKYDFQNEGGVYYFRYQISALEHCLYKAALLMRDMCGGVGGGVAGGNPRQRGRYQALPLRDNGGPAQGKPSLLALLGF